MNKMFKQSLLASLLFSTALYSGEIGLNFGAHDMIVANIDTPEFNGGNSHTLGINVGIFAQHTTPHGFNVYTSLDGYLDFDKDHLDPNHIPLWYKFLFELNGPLYKINENLLLQWHVEMKNKINTVSSIEREVKQLLGAKLEYKNDRIDISLKALTGFFYLEIDDDAPLPAGYIRRDLGNGTSSISLMLDTEFKLTQDLLLKASAQNWSSVGVGSGWLEHEFIEDLSYSSDAWLKDSRMHLNVDTTIYNLEPYYRADLGVPVLPWDNDTLVRAYMSIPWDL